MNEKTEIKLAECIGLETIRDKKGKFQAFFGSDEQLEELNRLIGVLEEQFETEADIIRENNFINI